MKYFSVPADFKKETIDKYEKLNNQYPNARVVETYGNVTLGNCFGSGRVVETIPRIDWNQMEEFVRYSKKKHIEFNYTFNASHMQNIEFTPRGVLEIIRFLERLYEVGIRSLTIALPSLMELVNSCRYDFEIKASVICQITNQNKALQYKTIGARRILADESINRNFTRLKQITRAFGDKVELIVNSICHKDCVYRMFHYNQISTDSLEVTSEASANYYTHRCLMRRYQQAGNILRLNWIRPEDIRHYTNIGIRYFKLQGRHTVSGGDPVRAVECYFKEHYQGDLLELLDLFNPTSKFNVTIDNRKLEDFLKPFYQNENFCQQACSTCGYCDSIARRQLGLENAAKEVYRDACEFYRQYDPFKKMMHAVMEGKQDRKNKQEKKPEVGFRFDT